MAADPAAAALQVGTLLGAARRKLEGCEDGALAAQLLLGLVLGKPRTWVVAHPEALLTPGQALLFDSYVTRVTAGEPLPYLLGRWEFFGREFEVTPDVLIPRPETELLVENALSWLAGRAGDARVAEAGAGSGCIAVSLAVERPGLCILAVDRSRAALRVARRNALRHGVSGQVVFLQGNLLSAVAGPFDLVCANLPYIPTGRLAKLPAARFEPLLALDGGRDGLAVIHALLSDSTRFLAPGGRLLLEVQFDQAEPVAALAASALPSSRVSVLPDLAGHPRLAVIDRPAREGAS